MQRRSIVPLQESRLAGRSRHSRELHRAVQHERDLAVVDAARINRMALTAHVTLQRLGELSSTEMQLIRMAPLGEGRYAAIADETAMAMAALLRRQAMDMGL